MTATQMLKIWKDKFTEKLGLVRTMKIYSYNHEALLALFDILEKFDEEKS